MENNQQIGDIYEAYKNKLFSELKISDLPAKEKEKYEEKINTLVMNRLMNLVLIYLPEDKIEEFNAITDNGNEKEIFDFLGKSIPDFGAKVANELMEIRSDIINSVTKHE